VSGPVVLRWTILAATVLWAWSEILRIRQSDRVEPARRLYTAALALALVHVAVAFDVAYAWSHEAAFEGTARQTAAVTGLRWGGGVFVNYLFLAAWTADALYWWASPNSYRQRGVRADRARLALFLFMFINGAIIFAGPVARAVGIPAIAAVCTLWALEARRRPARA
jgi:hypothetical protein